MVSRLGLIVLTSTILSGCQQFSDAFMRSDYLKPEKLFVYDFSDYQPGKNPELKKENPNDKPISSKDDIPVINTSISQLAIQDSTGQQRDFIQNILIKRSDDLCADFLDDLFIRVTSRKFTLKNLAGAASAVGTFASGVAQEMNLVSTLALGLNDAYNEDVMKGQLSHLLSNQIQTDRVDILEKIENKRKNKNENAYSFSQSLLDVNKYHEKCSLTSSLASLTKSTTTKKTD